MLTAAAFATSILSAVLGLAGGIVLLSVILLFVDPLQAIPLHGVVQLVSNAARSWIQRAHVERGIVWRYALLLLPMGFIGLRVAQSLSPPVARALIGAFVLVATWVPRWLTLGTHPERSDRNLRFVVLGGVVGVLNVTVTGRAVIAIRAVLNVTVGATGPLIAPFFLNLGLTRQAIIGTQAACQMLGHLAKLPIFGFAGFPYLSYAAPLATLSLAVIAGTWVGSRILGHVNELWFRRLYMGVLTLIALRLLLGSLT